MNLPMNNSSFKVIIRTDFTKKDGTNSIYLQFITKRRRKLYSLNLSCTLDKWDFDKQRVKNSYPNSFNINTIIDEAYNRGNNIIFNYKVSHKKLTISEFDKKFNDLQDNGSFYLFIENHIKENEHSNSKEYTKTLLTQLSKMKKFRAELSFDDIDFDLIKKYENYMLSVLNNNKNTVNKTLTFIKNMLNKAIQKDIIKENIFRKIKISKIEGNRNYLSLSELKILEEMLTESKVDKYYKNVLKYFLFSCYTGLRFQDIKELRFKHIQEDIISLIMHKTKLIVKIPLSNKAKKMINEVLESEPMEAALPEKKIFNVLTNQATNRHLKIIMETAKIEKNISFHCSRHTFATNSYNLGIPSVIITKMLGHTDVKTTQLYIKYSDSEKIKEIKKWDN